MKDRLDASLESFLRHLAQERRVSLHTRRAYERDLKPLAATLRALGRADWGDARSSDVRAFVARRHRQGLGPRSLQRTLSAIRSLYRYLLREGVVGHNPAVGIRAPRAPSRLPRVLEVDRVAALLAFDPSNALAVRDLAILELLYSCGLRLAELVGLDVGHLDLAAGLVVVTGKGGKQRVLPVGRCARDALRAWLSERRQLARPGEAALFVARSGTRLKPRSVQSRLARWGMQQGVGAKLHPHTLRHCFASHLLESSGDLRAVQELLGHADISTTQVYTHLDHQHLAKVYDAAHPRARRR